MSEPNRPDDRELDEFIAGRSESSRRYREAIEREGPSKALDDAILGQARRAIEADQRAKRRRFVVPLALAATVVLSFSVFVGVRQERAGSANVALTADEQATSARPAPPQARQLPAPAAPPSVAEAVGMQKAAVPSERESARVQAEPQAEPDRRKEQPAMNAASAPVMVAPPPESKPESPAAPMAAEAAADRADGADSAGVAVQAPPSKSLTNKRSQLRDERARKTALEKIRMLKEKGDLDEARVELEKFRDAHPGDEIPDDLRPLLRPVTPPSP